MQSPLLQGIPPEFSTLQTLEQKDKIITDVMTERDRWAHMAESLQEEKQKLLTDGRAGSERGFWKRLFS